MVGVGAMLRVIPVVALGTASLALLGDMSSVLAGLEQDKGQGGARSQRGSSPSSAGGWGGYVAGYVAVVVGACAVGGRGGPGEDGPAWGRVAMLLTAQLVGLLVVRAFLGLHPRARRKAGGGGGSTGEGPKGRVAQNNVSEALQALSLEVAAWKLAAGLVWQCAMFFGVYAGAAVVGVPGARGVVRDPVRAAVTWATHALALLATWIHAKPEGFLTPRFLTKTTSCLAFCAACGACCAVALGIHGGEASPGSSSAPGSGRVCAVQGGCVDVDAAHGFGVGLVLGALWALVYLARGRDRLVMPSLPGRHRLFRLKERVPSAAREACLVVGCVVPTSVAVRGVGLESVALDALLGLLRPLLGLRRGGPGAGLARILFDGLRDLGGGLVAVFLLDLSAHLAEVVLTERLKSGFATPGTYPHVAHPPRANASHKADASDVDPNALLVEACGDSAEPLLRWLAFQEAARVLRLETDRRQAMYAVPPVEWQRRVGLLLDPVEAMAAATRKEADLLKRRSKGGKDASTALPYRELLPPWVQRVHDAALLEMSRRSTFADAQRAVWALRCMASLVSVSSVEDRLGVMQLSGALQRSVKAALDLLTAVEAYESAAGPARGTPEGDALGGGERRAAWDPRCVAEAARGCLHEVVSGFTRHGSDTGGLLWALTEGADDDEDMQDGDHALLFPQGRKHLVLSRADLAKLNAFAALDSL